MKTIYLGVFFVQNQYDEMLLHYRKLVSVLTQDNAVKHL